MPSSKEYMKEWRAKNAEHRRQYKKDNRERDNQKRRELRANRKDEEYKKNHEYYLENKERINKRTSNYYQTEKGRKIRIIRGWKTAGIIDGDFESLLDYYCSITECPICDFKFEKKQQCEKVFDHDHETGEPRMVLCRQCNINEKNNIVIL